MTVATDPPSFHEPAAQRTWGAYIALSLALHAVLIGLACYFPWHLPARLTPPPTISFELAASKAPAPQPSSASAESSLSSPTRSAEPEADPAAAKSAVAETAHQTTGQTTQPGTRQPQRAVTHRAPEQVSSPPPTAYARSSASSLVAPSTSTREQSADKRNAFERKPQPAATLSPAASPNMASPAAASALESPSESGTDFRPSARTSNPGSRTAESKPPARAHENAAPKATGQTDLFTSWKGQLLKRLERSKHYPRLAREQHQQGVAYLRFAIDATGRVLTSRIERSSGVDTLDQETLSLLHRAEPLPAPPELSGDRLELIVPVQFFLK